jgi:hypothetical protein
MQEVSAFSLAHRIEINVGIENDAVVTTELLPDGDAHG